MACDCEARRGSGVGERLDRRTQLIHRAEELTGRRDAGMSADRCIQIENGKQRIGRMRRHLLPGLDDWLRVRPRPLERVDRHLSDRVRAEDEPRDDAEVPPSASTQGPVQIRVPARVAHDGAAVSENDCCLEQVVAREPELPRGEADAAAERQTPDAHGRARSAGNGAAELRQMGVHVDQPCAGADHRMTVPVERDPVQPRDVHHDAGRRRITAVAVPTRPRDDPNRVTPRPADGPLDVGERLAEDDRLRLVRVEAGVVEDASLVVRRIAPHDNGA